MISGEMCACSKLVTMTSIGPVSGSRVRRALIGQIGFPQIATFLRDERNSDTLESKIGTITFQSNMNGFSFDVAEGEQQ